MKEKDTAVRRELTADDSWANETLPMGVRRELLDREIRRFAASRGNTQAHGNNGSAHSPHSERPQES